MATINSVLGPLDTADLGFTLMHEHVCSTSPGFWQAWPELFGGRETFIQRVVGHLQEARAEGVHTFVDVTTIDLGRDIRLIQEVARRSGMQIIACTGHWLDVSWSMAARTVDELAAFFTREIQQGIEGTDIKAGIIKVANDREGITEAGEKMLRAAASAHKVTGVPITTHHHAPNRVGDRQADIFEEEGVNPSRVSIGHSDDTTNVKYLLGILQRGFYLDMDRLPLGPFIPPDWETRVNTIKALIDAGYTDRLLLSHDYPLGLGLAPTERMEFFRQMNPDHILFISRKVLPRLRQLGVTEEVIYKLTVENPRRFFEGG